MNVHLKRIAAGLAVAAVSGLGTAGAHASAAAASPGTRPVSCSSSSAWVKLYGKIGERCYTGNGTEIVNLSGVREMKISGRHDVCLTVIPVRRTCYPTTRTRTVLFRPPVNVRLISIVTP